MARMQKLPLNRISFGSIDARFEVTSRELNSIAAQHFKTSFMEPIDIRVEEFMTGDRFVVYGSKGTGKTSFLKYLEIQVKQKNHLTKFITFSSDITASERNKISTLGGVDVIQQNIEIESGEKTLNDFNVVDVWMIFILRQIARVLETNKSDYETHKSITVFCELMRRFYDKESETGLLSWLAKTLKTGKYKFKTKFVDAELKGSEKEKEREFPISYIIDQSMKFLSDLEMIGNKGIYIFFDELNLAFSSRPTHKRDIILIRDLLIAIDRLNHFFAEEKLQLFIVAGARSDVLHAFSAPTHEISKILKGRGKEIRWYGRTGSENAPIMDLLKKKIHASESIERIPLSKNPLETYFMRELYELKVDQFVVEHTWCNPRDLVLLFGEAASKSQPHEHLFGDQVVNRVFESYSAAVWSERAEELSVEYAQQEVLAIKKLLLNFKKFFKLTQLEVHWDYRAENDQTIMQMRKKYNINKLLEDLYRIGILGSSSREPDEKSKSFSQHWLYRGNDTFDSTDWLIVHKALWPELRLGKVIRR